MSVGDINSAARGSGARFNDGKPALDLVPLAMIAQSMRDPLRGPQTVAPEVESALHLVGLFQVTGERAYLVDAMNALSNHWEDCARVFDYGRKKYAAWNWAKGMAWSIPLACIGRHALKSLRGERYDDESGELHEGHILCNIVMLMTFVDTFPEGNDLPPPELFRAAA